MEGNLDSGIQETFARGIQNLKIICLWNQESYFLESGM